MKIIGRQHFISNNPKLKLEPSIPTHNTQPREGSQIFRVGGQPLNFIT